MVLKTKEQKNTTRPGNLIILILGYSVFLGGFELEVEVLDVFGVNNKFVEWRSDEDFIFYDRHEFWEEIVMRHVKLIWWEF